MAIVAAVISLIKIVASLLGWYNANNAEAEKALRDAAEKRVAELEAQRMADNAAARMKDVDEGTEVIESGSRKRAVGFVLDSFPKDSTGSS